jgi:hypothetical protein
MSCRPIRRNWLKDSNFGWHINAVALSGMV